MKLCKILFFCVLVVQKVATEPEQDEYENQTDSPGDESSTALPTCQCQTQSNQEQAENNCGNPTVDPFSKFSARLYQLVTESQAENFILSPLSLRNAVTMLSLGAAGETAAEFQRVLQLPADPRELINRQSDLISSLNNISSPSLGLKFVTGDAVFVTHKYRLQQQFKDHVAGLRGEIGRTDFKNGGAAAKKINEWVQSKTEKKIDKIVEPEDLNDQISLLVLNSIYFKGPWANKFNKSETKPLPFFPNASCSLTVDMMTQENEFQFADLDDAKAQVIVLPYKGERLSMMIYLPFKRGNPEGALDTLENWLKDQSPFDIQTEYLGKPETVKVSLPKFKIRSSLQLNEPLQRFGLRKMFDAVGGNFSGIFNDPRNFFVSKVSQETFIEVNEEGTEAAGVTGSELAATSITPDFTANRPFLFQIVDNTTKTVLFSGRVKNPLETADPSDSGARNSQCVRIKSKVEEMLLEFRDFLAPSERESRTSEIPSQAARFQALVGKYENKTFGAVELLQSMNNTLKKLEKTEEESEKKGQRIGALETEKDELERTKGQLENRVSSQSGTINRLNVEVNSTLIRLEEKEKDVRDKTRKIQELEENEARLKTSVKELQNLIISQKEGLDRMSAETKNLSKILAQKIATFSPADSSDPSPATTTTDRTTTRFPEPQRGWSSQQAVTERSTARPPRITTRQVKAQEKKQSPSVGLSAAAAWVYECTDSYCGYFNTLEYNGTVDRSCKNFYNGINAVYLTGSCVVLYENTGCGGRKFQLNTENSDKGNDIRKQFPNTPKYGNTWYSLPKSIGPCR